MRQQAPSSKLVQVLHTPALVGPCFGLRAVVVVVVVVGVVVVVVVGFVVVV